jgi:uncharacterized repeat protein (TIGR01451 family)
VSGGGMRQDSTAEDSIEILAAPAITITSSHQGELRHGQAATYNLTVSNSRAGGASAGLVTVIEKLPKNLTLDSINGQGWDCNKLSAICERSDTLRNGSSYPPITVKAYVSTAAEPMVVNLAIVQGVDFLADAVPDITTIVADPALKVSIKPAVNFKQGQKNASYVIELANGAGAGTTTAPVTVKISPPGSGLESVSLDGGKNWQCQSSSLSCQRNDTLPGGKSYDPITWKVDIARNAPANVISKVIVSGGGMSERPEDQSDTPISPIVPMLSIHLSHEGNFKPGQQDAAYRIVVSNAPEAAPTNGLVTVEDDLPAGLELVSMTGGPNWRCQGKACQRSDALEPGKSYEPITVVVKVTGSLGRITNVATVSADGAAREKMSDPTDVKEQ